MLAGASIQHCIAQLMSNMGYDGLLTFLLTSSTYIDANDLLHLLIGRFHSALQVPSGSGSGKRG
jgi:hypothetical protein